ncbi:MAG: hypothetical protein IPM92_00270 [Saprospiraceae bacterium]|nr:hypothetical protein [Saprospiraceae bacterium]
MKNLKPFLLWLIMFSHSFIFTQQFKFEWARSFGGSKDEIDRVMKVDKKGDLYLFCEVYSSHFSIDNRFFFDWINPENYPSNAVLLKYSPSGELLWGRALKTNIIGIEAYGIVIDQDNNVIISGFHQGNEIYLDTVKLYSSVNVNSFAFILKLNEEGELLKYQTFAEVIRGTLNNQGGIAIDKSGNYYLPAQTRKSIIDKNKDTIFNSDLTKGRYLLLFKLDQDFNPIWIKKYYNVDGYFGDVKVDGEDNIIVYGMFRGRELTVDSFTVRNAETVYLQEDFGQDEVYILKLNGDGETIWLKSVQGKDVEYCAYNDISFDKENNIYLGGMFGSDTLKFSENIYLHKDKVRSNFFDIFYSVYDKTGECQWAKTIERKIEGLADNMSIHLISSNHLIISGNYSTQNFQAGNAQLSNKGRSDSFILLANNNGEIITGTTYGGENNDYEQQVASDGRSVYIFGMFGSRELMINDTILKNDTTDGSLDAVLIKYSIDSLTSASNLPEDQIEIGVYPNPAKEQIRLQLPEAMAQGLLFYNLFDIDGKWVSSGLLRSKHAEISVRSLLPGQYIIKGGSLGAKKFVGRFMKME